MCVLFTVITFSLTLSNNLKEIGYELKMDNLCEKLNKNFQTKISE